MAQMLAQISIVVNDYDEAIEFYTRRLGFIMIEDTELSDSKRWVVVAPKDNKGNCCLVLARAVNDEQKSRIGNQTGGRVFLFLHTDDFWNDYRRYRDSGVEFIREPIAESYGTVAVFKDLYGNLWDLIQK